MNYIDEIELTKLALKSNGFEDLAKELSEQQLSCGTGGEVLESICAKLLGMKKEYPIAYNLISCHADKLIAYANSIGYYPIAVSSKRHM